jgi:CubicO group peptidase (beta-lactamase class C family)
LIDKDNPEGEIMLFRSVLAASVLALSALAPSQAQEFSEDGLVALQAALDDRTERGIRSGYSVMLVRNGETRALASGHADAADQDAIGPDTPVRIASMAKPITAAAVMILVDDGVLSLDDPLSDYLPEYAGIRVAVSPMRNGEGEFDTVPTSEPITLHHLMTHTSGLGYLFDGQSDLGQAINALDLYGTPGTLAEKMTELSTLPLYFQPGEMWAYSWSNDVLGRVIEVATETPFEDFLETRLFAPLGMDATTFFLSEDELSRLAENFVHGEDQQLYPAYSDDNPERTQTWASGGAGLVSTANDYAVFASMLLNGGVHDGQAILTRESLAAMTSPQVTADQLPGGMNGLSYGFGVGIVLPAADGETALGIPGDYGWSGYFDTDFFISPSTGLIAIIMTQVIPTDNRPEGSTRSWWRGYAYGTLAQ